MIDQVSHLTIFEVKFAIKLFNVITKILSEHFDARATMSQAKLIEMSIHIHKDIQKLFRIHQTSEEALWHGAGEIDPLKLYSYICFWLLKLKPITDCYQKTEDAAEREIIDINERMAVHISVYNVIRIALSGKLDYFKQNSEISHAHFAERVSNAFKSYRRIISPHPDDGENPFHVNSLHERLIYDMRFRTFGPHHLSHWLTQAVVMAGGA